MTAITPFSFDQKDPTSLVWPPTLPIELALKTASPGQLRTEYGYDEDEWERLSRNPAFLKDLAGACEMVRQEGMSFKLKARLIAEENLKTAWKMIHDPHVVVPPSVKADLIKSVARWAGYEQRPGAENAAGGQNNQLNIQINLGSDY